MHMSEATSSRPQFTTSQKAAEEAREASEEKWEKEGRGRVTSNSFGNARSVSHDRPSAWATKHEHKPVYSRGIEGNLPTMQYAPGHEPSPQQMRDAHLEKLAKQRAENDRRKK